MEWVKTQKRSEKLTKEERAAFKKWMAGFDTQDEAAREIGVSRTTLDRILLKGSGKPASVSQIRAKINQ